MMGQFLLTYVLTKLLSDCQLLVYGNCGQIIMGHWYWDKDAADLNVTFFQPAANGNRNKI